MAGAKIGEADIEVEADLKKFEQQVQKIKKQLESLDTKVTVTAKLARNARKDLQAQLTAMKNLKVNVTANITRKSVQDSLSKFATPPKVAADLSFTKAQLRTAIKAVATPKPVIHADLEIDGDFGSILKSLGDINNALAESTAEARETNRWLRQQAAQHRANLDNLRLVNDTVTQINRGFQNSLPFIDQQRQGLRDTQNNLRRTLQQILNINKLKDPFPVIVGSSLSGELLLNTLARVLKSTFLLRKSFIQIGSVAATAFAGIAQAAGAAAIGIASAIKAGGVAAGLGLITIGVKLQITNNAEVAAAVANLKTTFNDVFTESSAALGPVITEFSNGLSKSLNTQKAAFTGFFNTVAPGLQKVGQAVNNFLQSEKFTKLIDAVGKSTANFLTNFANKLPAIIQGIEDIGKKFLEISPRIKKALGPGIFSGLSVDKVIAGLERFTKIIESAGPGIRAFKAAFGNIFGEAIKQIEQFASVIGQVGPRLFNSLGNIGVAAVHAFGTALQGAVIGADKALAIAQGSLSEFLGALGDNAGQSFIILGDAIGHVVDRAAQLGTILAPLITIAAQLSAALEPVVNPIFNLLDAIGELAVAIGNFLVPAVDGFLVAISPVVAAVSFLGQGIVALGQFVLSVISPFSGLIGAIVGVVAVVGAITAAMSALGGVLGAAALGITVFNGAGIGLGATLTGLLTRIPLVGAAMRGFSVSMSAGAAVSRAFGTAAATIAPSLAGVVGAGAAASVSTRLFAASATNANIALRALQAGNVVTAASFSVLAAGEGIAAVASRVFGVALRFALGPIGLILAAVLLFSGALSGLAEIAKGVGDIIVGLFTFDTDKISEGWDKVKQGAKDVGNAVVDTFTGSGGDAGQGMGDAAAAGAKSGFAQITLDASQAGKASGQTFFEQFKSGFQNLDFKTQITGLEALFKDGGLLAGDGFVQSAEDRLLVANLAEAVQIDQGIIDQFKETGDAAGSGLTQAIRDKINSLDLQSTEGVKQLQSLIAYGNSIGGEAGKAIVDQATAALNKGAPGAQKAASDAIKPGDGEAAKQGQEAADELIDTVTKALESAAPQITASISLAFDQALSTLGEGILGPKLANALSTGFKFMIANSAGLASQITASLSLAFDTAFATLGEGVLGPKLSQALTTGFQFMIANSGGLSNQITASLSLAFDGAFAILPPILGEKISNMLSVAFATSIATSTGTLTPQIVASLSLAFDGAFAILPAILGPKISTMLGLIFSTVPIDGLTLAASLTRVFTGAFGLAFISLPAVISPGLSTALNDGANQALQTFGTGLQGQINAAFTEAFSGVGAAINGPLSAAFLGATGNAATFASTIGGIMQGAAADVNAALAPLATTIPQPFSEGFGEAIRVTKQQLDALLNAVKQTKAQIDAIDFYGSGYQIGARLAAGIRAATAAEVVPAADAMAAAVKDRTPNSPAKKGPLSGQGDPLRTGGNIVKRLVMGMREQIPVLKKAIEDAVAEFHKHQGQIAIDPSKIPNFAFTRPGGISVGLGGAGAVGGALSGATNPNIGGRILKQDTQASIGTGGRPTQQIQIRPGNVNVLLQGIDNPRDFFNALSKELLTLTTGR